MEEYCKLLNPIKEGSTKYVACLKGLASEQASTVKVD